LELHSVECPYCGETFEASIEATIEEQEYIEDCEICCRPITFRVRIDWQGGTKVDTRHENEA
jgi:hypothetical protein